MDPSALIFIALAVAWAVYLIPKALEHHDESVRTRTVEKFSATMRVLARREPVSRRRARLVRAGAKQAPESTAHTAVPVVRRSAAACAARRRRRVLTLVLLAIVVVAGLAVAHVVVWLWVAAPVALLGAWLVACRVMVKHERRGSRPMQSAVTQPARPAVPRTQEAAVDPEETGAIPVVPDAQAGSAEGGRPDPTDPQSWDPVPVTLPTYVSKAAAPRSVRTIDLESTGVWTSGRSESDSELVRESKAQASERSDGAARDARRRRA